MAATANFIESIREFAAAMQIWVVINARYQSSAQRILHDVTLGSIDVVRCPQGPVVERARPEWSRRSCHHIRRPGAGAFQPNDELGQTCRSAELDKPVRVIGHENPCKQLRITDHACVAKAACCRRRDVGSRESWLAVNCCTGDEVRGKCDGVASDA